MKSIKWALIFRREFRSYFQTPLAYSVLSSLSLLGGYLMTSLMAYFQNSLVVTFWLGNMGLISVFLCPLLTMKTFSEERENHTRWLWQSAGISQGSMVWGKYLSAAALWTLILSMSLPIAFIMGKGALIGAGYLGVALVGYVLLAIGMTGAVMFESQIGAALWGWMLGLAFWMLGGIATAFPAPIQTALTFMGLQTHLDQFLQGTISVAAVGMYLISALIWIALSIQILRFRQDLNQRQGLRNGLATLMLGGVALWGISNVNWEVDGSGRIPGTLSAKTQKVLKELRHPVQITLVNVQESGQEKSLTALLHRYHRANPQITWTKRQLNNAEPSLMVRTGTQQWTTPLEALTLLLDNPPQEWGFAEPVLTGMLSRIVAAPPVMGWISGTTQNNTQKGPNGTYWLAAALAQEPYTVTANLQNAQVIIVEGLTRQLTRIQQGALIRFVERGGSLIILQDPAQAGVINPLIHHWGVQIQDTPIVDESQSNYFRQEDLLPKLIAHPMTAPLIQGKHQPLLAVASPIMVSPNQKIMPLLQSSAQSWTQGNTQHQGPFNLAVLYSVVGGGQVVVVSNRAWITNQLVHTQGNRELILSMLAVLTHQAPSIHPTHQTLDQKNFSRLDFALLTVWSLVILPGGWALFGLILWWKRKKW